MHLTQTTSCSGAEFIFPERSFLVTEREGSDVLKPLHPIGYRVSVCESLLASNTGFGKLTLIPTMNLIG